MKKVKDMSEDEVWEACIGMWEYIVSKLKWYHRFILDPEIIYHLKEEYLGKQGYNGGKFYNYIRSNCFFCAASDVDCSTCPGALVDTMFRCNNGTYFWVTKPHKFLAKIKSLNERRLNELVNTTTST